MTFQRLIKNWSIKNVFRSTLLWLISKLISPPPGYKPTQTPLQSCISQGLISGPWVHRFWKFSVLCFCLFVFCLLVFFFVSCAFPPPTSGKIKCVTFCCVTQTKQACKLSARNYRFEILQRIQIKKRRLIGENCFEVQVRQNHFIPEGS